MSSETCEFCAIHDCWHGAPGDDARGERYAVARYLRKCAAEESRHAQSMRADAGSQAEPEARGIDRVVRALEGAAETIEQGRHWR